MAGVKFPDLQKVNIASQSATAEEMGAFYQLTYHLKYFMERRQVKYINQLVVRIVPFLHTHVVSIVKSKNLQGIW